MANDKTRIVTGQVFIAGGAVGGVLGKDSNSSTSTRQVGMSVIQVESAGQLLATCSFVEDGTFNIDIDYDNFIPPLTVAVDFQEDGVFGIAAIQTQQTYEAHFQEDGAFLPNVTLIEPLFVSADFQEDGVFDIFVDYETFVPPLTPVVDFQEDGVFTPTITTSAALHLSTGFVEDGTMFARVKAIRKPARLVCVVSG